MKSSEASSFRSFKSRKILRSSSDEMSSCDPKLSPAPSKVCTEETDLDSVHLDQVTLCSKTPEKAMISARSSGNQRAIFSLKGVREAAEKLRKSRRQPRIEPDSTISDGLQDEATASTASPSQGKKVNNLPMLPERYAILAEFFDRLDSSILLLRGSTPTFSNIKPKIESFTNRRFTYGHLAQLKYILPEVIEIKKTVTRDELTLCMKPDIQINLNIAAIMKQNQLLAKCGNMFLKKIFRKRLMDYFKNHPEGDVPEETLPEPFNKSKKDDPVSKKANSTFVNEIQQTITSSHLPKSFRRVFSAKASGTESFNSPPLVAENTNFENVFPKKISNNFVEPDCAAASSSSLLTTPLKQKFSSKADVFTPGKFISTPSSATPEMKTPKRCLMTTPDNEPVKLVRRPSRNRSLIFETPVKSHKNVDESSVYSELSDILPDSVLQSIREKELKAREDQDPAISQAKWRKLMISHLPKTFDMIVYLYQSVHRSVFAKNDLIHKIISNNMDIVDRREVEEQIKLLQEIAPEWIYEKLASTGDLLICINKVSSPESIRARLAEVN